MSPTLTAKITRLLSLGVAVILVLLPFHAFLTVWLSSGVGHYTLLRLWKEVALVPIGLVGLGLLIRDKKLRAAFKQQQVLVVIGVYLLLQLFLAVTSFTHHQVSGKALAYGLLDDSRFLVFFALCATLAARDRWLAQHWRPLVFIPAGIVVLFGLAQITFLPHDVLAHFGYGPQTIPVSETINSNAHYLRVQSTLRGANPLGAYLVLIIALLAVEGIGSKLKRDRLLYALGGVLSLTVLYYTYSRGAWIGAVLALGVVVYGAVTTKRAKQLLALATLGGAALLIIGVLLLGSSTHFKNVIFHTSPHTVATTSDQNHDSALKDGLHDLVRDPLGRGPGSAGPASVYNHDRPARVPENYFVQIGLEFGWLGLILFLLITGLVAIILWRSRDNSLALGLLAALIGISVVGLVSQVWTDDTLCYLYWGFAGLILAPKLLPKGKH